MLDCHVINFLKFYDVCLLLSYSRNKLFKNYFYLVVLFIKAVKYDCRQLHLATKKCILGKVYMSFQLIDDIFANAESRNPEIIITFCVTGS